MSRITVVGLGPGNPDDITPAAQKALQHCQVVVGYKFYMTFVKPFLNPEAKMIDTGMKREQERAAMAFDEAEKGKDVVVVSSGDANIYGMAPLILEMKKMRESQVDIQIIPGISAFQKAASLLGAPMGHDFCVISLSDLMTPWNVIERRIKAAATADFVTAIYNPKSHDRYWQLYRLKELFLESRSESTPVGYVRQAGRDDETIGLTTLEEFDPEEADMLTVVIIGNSQSFIYNDKFITPRGYFSVAPDDETVLKAGQQIMMNSFRNIQRELKQKDIPLERKWPLLHAIHTTADFEMEQLLKVDDNALPRIYETLSQGRVKTIITDVTMAASGIRKGALKRLGLEVKCFLNDEETSSLATEEGITRSQAGIRRAVEVHPDALFVFGNAPTALMELCRLVKMGKAHPCGIVAAPVGFVHVEESKHMVKPFVEIPKIIVEGRKGGSNLAATLVNAILCWPDAELLKPGRDV